jgi:hypothetical protein
MRARATPASSRPDVRRPRAIIEGTRGADVVAVKRALSRAGYMRWGTFTPLWGEFAVRATKRFQRDKNITPVTGFYGPKTHKELVAMRKKGSRTEWAFDAYSIALMLEQAQELAERPDERVRGAIVAEARRLYANRHRIPYAQERPFALERPPFVPPRMDCSEFVTVCHFVGGAPDPNGFNYNGSGYTGTLIAHGERCSSRELEAGDLAFYGLTTNPRPGFPFGSPTHVALYDGNGGVYSMGSSPMGHFPLRYRTVNHFRHYDIR